MAKRKKDKSLEWISNIGSNESKMVEEEQEVNELSDDGNTVIEEKEEELLDISGFVGRKTLTKIREMLKTQGYNIHNGTLYNYAKRVGVGRGRSEARRNWDPDSLDYNKTYIDENMIKWMDGFCLGDGGISSNNNTCVARFSCGVEYEEFCKYLMTPFLSLGSNLIAL